MPGNNGREADAAAARGLDWLNLFVANIQTGFGPFIAVYLTGHGWTETAIGFALSIGTVTAMASQVPAGALVDAISRKALVAGFSLLAFTASAFLLAVAPSPLFVYLAEILHGFSSCTLGPAIAAMSLVIVGRVGLGPRFGRNARFASIGNGVGAALMGAAGYYISDRAVFFLTAALTLPALATLVPLSRIDTGKREAPRRDPAGRVPIGRVLGDRRLIIFAGSAALFTLANAAMLPLAGSMMTVHAGKVANLLIAAAIILPQIVVALSSPKFGRWAEERGRRPILLLGFSMLPLRGLAFALTADPAWMLAIQVADGIAAACFGIMVPLITSDIAGSTGHYNLSLGFVGFAIGVGGTFSTSLAGLIADRYSNSAAFLLLGGIGLAATVLILIALPETRPGNSSELEQRKVVER
jgi:MFS family permease